MSGADQRTLADTAVSTENLDAHATLNENLIEFNRHCFERARAEMLEAWHVLIKINTEPHAVERMKLYQEWLEAFSRRRVEDATYMAEAAKALSVVNLRVSLGLDTRRQRSYFRST